MKIDIDQGGGERAVASKEKEKNPNPT